MLGQHNTRQAELLNSHQHFLVGGINGCNQPLLQVVTIASVPCERRAVARCAVVVKDHIDLLGHRQVCWTLAHDRTGLNAATAEKNRCAINPSLLFSIPIK